MAGKYSHLKKTLTRFTGVPEYQERVNNMKDEIHAQLAAEDRPISVKTIGEIYVKARQEKERLEDLEKAQNLIIETTNQMLVDLLEGLDASSVKLRNNITISMKDDVYVTVNDKEAFYKWIHEESLEDLLTVNYQTMAAMVKNKLIEAQPIPPGIDTYFKASIRMLGGKYDQQTQG
jgi:hypothetical protein